MVRRALFDTSSDEIFLDKGGEIFLSMKYNRIIFVYRIGPEPTTDRFVAVMEGLDERIIPGNALAVSADMPYRGLDRFGVAFLNRFGTLRHTHQYIYVSSTSFLLI